MSNLLFSLALGAMLVIAANLALFRFSALGATRGALVVAVATLGLLSTPGVLLLAGG
jgi:hypothetical protein